MLFRAFGLSEENVQVDPEREHIKMTVLQDYKQKLKIEENIIPDPIDRKFSWINDTKMEWKNDQDYIFLTADFSFVLGKDNLTD